MDRLNNRPPKTLAFRTPHDILIKRIYPCCDWKLKPRDVGQRKGDTQWETKAKRIRTRVRNRRKTKRSNRKKRGRRSKRPNSLFRRARNNFRRGHTPKRHFCQIKSRQPTRMSARRHFEPKQKAPHSVAGFFMYVGAPTFRERRCRGLSVSSSVRRRVGPARRPRWWPCPVWRG